MLNPSVKRYVAKVFLSDLLGFIEYTIVSSFEGQSTLSRFDFILTEHRFMFNILRKSKKTTYFQEGGICLEKGALTTGTGRCLVTFNPVGLKLNSSQRAHTSSEDISLIFPDLRQSQPPTNLKVS